MTGFTHTDCWEWYVRRLRAVHLEQIENGETSVSHVYCHGQIAGDAQAPRPRSLCRGVTVLISMQRYLSSGSCRRG